MPAPPLISWWPTRAHSGIDAFSHIVLKSPKPIVAGDIGDVLRVERWTMFFGAARRGEAEQAARNSKSREVRSKALGRSDAVKGRSECW